MNSEKLLQVWQMLNLRYKAHPWHGIDAGKAAPEILRSYIEVVPGDEMKYEICKESGYLMIDRPNKFSSVMPALYGFVPQTYCAEAVAEYCMQQSGKEGVQGDGDPLDICVLCDRKLAAGDLLVDAVVIGGFRMIDGGEADDKIIAVLKDDQSYGHIRDISEVPTKLLKRLKHYFLSYKEEPDSDKKPEVEITHNYGREEALEVVRRSQLDYQNHYGSLANDLAQSLAQILKTADASS